MKLQFNAVNGQQTVYVNPLKPSSSLSLGYQKTNRRFSDARVQLGQATLNQVFPYLKDKPCETSSCEKLSRDNSVHIKVSAPSEDVEQALSNLEAAYENMRAFILHGGLQGVRASIAADYYEDAEPTLEDGI